MHISAHEQEVVLPDRLELQGTPDFSKRLVVIADGCVVVREAGMRASVARYFLQPRFVGGDHLLSFAERTVRSGKVTESNRRWEKCDRILELLGCFFQATGAQVNVSE